MNKQLTLTTAISINTSIDKVWFALTDKETIKKYDVVFPMLAGVGDTSARAAFVIDKNGVVQYSEQTPTPKDLPNFNAVRETLGKLK